MKKLLLMLVVVASTITINAQNDLAFSVEAGLNFTKFTGDVDDCNMKPGFNVGVMVDVPFTDAIFLKSGLKYTQRGWKYKEGDYKEKENYGCLQIPILASYHLALSDGIELQAAVGPYIGIALHGKYKVEEDDWDYDEDIEFGDDGYIKRFDIGLVLPSVGVKFSNLYVGVSNELGLANLTGESDYKVHNYCFSINVGYTF